jgi:hypothetical protein
MDRRLRRATAGEPPYDKANALIDAALENGIPASPKAINAAKRHVESALKENLPSQIRQSVLATIVRLATYEAYTRIDVRSSRVGLLLPAVLYPISGGGLRFPAGLYPISRTLVMGPILIEGDNRQLSQIHAAFDYSIGSPAVFRISAKTEGHAIIGKLTVFRRVGKPSNAPELVGIDSPTNKVTVFDVSASNLSQNLARIIWLGVSFERCAIKYHGGPLWMADVSFTECTFDFASTETAQAVLAEIRAHGRQPITLVIP